jgi:hypothetical protein
MSSSKADQSISSARRPSIIASVRLPWATGPPNGLSRRARSGSLWIH